MRIVATVKPRPDRSERVRRLCDVGIRSFRVNFGRGLVEANADFVRELASLRRDAKVDRIFVDLPGRKSRLTPLPDGRRHLRAEETFSLVPNYQAPTSVGRTFGVTQDWVIKTLQLGDVVIVGETVGRMSAFTHHGIEVQVESAGDVYSGCVVQVPRERYVASQQLLESDRVALDAGAWLADFVCISFADHASLLAEASKLRLMAGSSAALVAKIESPAAVDNLDAIACEADALMLGRGDLASFFDNDEMDRISLELLSRARQRSCQVVFATDYFRSLTESTTADAPTSEEVSRLEAARRSQVEYLVINETATSDRWYEIAQVAVRYQG